MFLSKGTAKRLSSSYLPRAPVTSFLSSSIFLSSVSLSCKFITLGSKILSCPVSFPICSSYKFSACLEQEAPQSSYVTLSSFWFINRLTSAIENVLFFIQFSLRPHQLYKIIVNDRESYDLISTFISQLIQLINFVSCLKGSTCFKSAIVVSIFKKKMNFFLFQPIYILFL